MVLVDSAREVNSTRAPLGPESKEVVSVSAPYDAGTAPGPHLAREEAPGPPVAQQRVSGPCVAREEAPGPRVVQRGHPRHNRGTRAVGGVAEDIGDGGAMVSLREREK